jgi:hypothetical protein
MSLAEFGDIADQQLAKGKASLSGLTKSGPKTFFCSPQNTKKNSDACHINQGL